MREVHQQQTWVTRKLGPAFDPDTTCEYTGLRLTQSPMGRGTVAYWREDGVLRACRPMTEEELLIGSDDFSEPPATGTTRNKKTRP